MGDECLNPVLPHKLNAFGPYFICYDCDSVMRIKKNYIRPAAETCYLAACIIAT